MTQVHFTSHLRTVAPREAVQAGGDTVGAAQAAAYAAVDAIDFPTGFCRRDIGWREVAREQA